MAALVAGAPKPFRIILRSGWQDISLADLAQTPGDLALLEAHLPDAQVTLWPMHLTDLAELAIRRRFPKVAIVRGTLDPKSFSPVEPDLRDALQRSDLLLHGSAPLLLGDDALEHARSTRKPFGVVGVSLPETDDRVAALLANARFVYARESATLNLLRKANIGPEQGGPIVGVSPDSALAFDLRDDDRAAAFLKSVDLQAGGFLCCVPKLRYTPFRKAFAPAEVARRQAVSDQFAEPDHAKMRLAIVDWVRATDRPVLVCPEMTYQIEWMDKLLIEPLPPDVKKRVKKRDTFWRPDEAASVLARAAAVLSFEAHVPLLALAAGTPAVHLHQPTDGAKDRLMRDIGLVPWVHDIDAVTGEQISRTLSAIVKDLPAARATARQAVETAAARQKSAFTTIQHLMSR